jgi:hypothetical protein
LVAADPAAAEIETTLLEGNVKVSCTDAGSLPAGDVRFRFKDTVPFAAVVPEDNANESVCPKEAWAVNKTANNGAIQPVLERLVMVMLSRDRS